MVNKNIITIGNIGIKTNNISQYALNVGGSANVTSLYINGTQLNSTAQWSNSGSNIYYNTGYVGIGTTNPSYTLDVSGTIYIKQNIAYSTYQLISASNPLIFAENLASLGSTAGSYTPFFTFRNNGTGTSLNAYQYRFSDGNQSTRIHHNTTGNYQGYLEFNPPNASNGIGLYASNSSGAFGTGSGITVNTSGYVGILTTTPQTILSTGSSNQNIKLALYDDGITSSNLYGIGANSTALTFGAGVSQSTNPQMVLKNTGYVGIGTINPQYALDVNGSIRLNNALSLNNKLLILYDAGGIDTNFYGFGINSSTLRYQLPTSTPSYHRFYGGSTLLFEIGTTNTTTDNPFYITNNTASTSTSTGALKVSGGAGILGQVNAASFNASSDYRIKTDIVLLSDISYNVDHLKPIKYTNTQLEKEDMGFLAHEVQELFPFLVNGEKDGKDMQSLNYTGFIALLVKEVQDLKKENIYLKTRLDAIEKRLM